MSTESNKQTEAQKRLHGLDGNLCVDVALIPFLLLFCLVSCLCSAVFWPDMLSKLSICALILSNGLTLHALWTQRAMLYENNAVVIEEIEDKKEIKAE